jgi:hypothetical protein
VLGNRTMLRRLAAQGLLAEALPMLWINAQRLYASERGEAPITLREGVVP